MTRRLLAPFLALAGFSLPAALAAAAESPPPTDPCAGQTKPLVAEREVVRPFWMPLRLQAEQILARGYGVFHGFRFTDRLPESGITFVNQVVEDAGKRYKGVHYDHGNGLAVADVDGDGRLDLYFTTQLGPNELWRNLGGGRFERIAGSGTELADEISVSASFGDVDNDGDPDLYVTTVRFGNHLFVNDGKGRFEDVSRAAGVGYVGHSSGAVFFDYDKDGRLDLFVANVGKYTGEERGPGGYWIGFEDAFSGNLHPDRTEISRLYRNLDGRRYEDVTETTGLVEGGWNGDASPFDVDGDGWIDLYVTNMQGHDEVWRSVEGKRFEKKGRAYFPATPWGAMGIQVFDYDNDGRLDVYVTDMHTDMIEVLPPTKEKSKMPRQRPMEHLTTDGHHVLGNALFHDDGSGRYSERSDAMQAENFWPWGLSSGDLNADGWTDVFITASMNYPWRYGVNSLLLNDQGRRFDDAVFLTGIEPRRGGETAKPWFDLDCSGADKEHVECRGKSGCITVLGALGSRSSAIFDLDDDGDLDIVTNDFNSPPLVLVSNLSEQKPIHYLKLRLVGTASNRSGLGARVTVEAGGRSFLKVNDGTSGYLSHSDMPLYFGLGEATSVEAIEIDWPSGIHQSVPSPITIDTLVTVTEPPAAGAAANAASGL